MQKKVNPKIIYIAFVVTVLVLGSLVIFLSVHNIRKNSKKEDELDKIHMDLIKNQMNKENTSVLNKNGGTVKQFGEYAEFINTYLSFVSESSYEDAYELYATDLVSKKGYTYSFDEFEKHCIDFKNKLEIDGENSFLTAHYRSYIENENYVLVSLFIGRRQGATYDNAVSVEYTLIKVDKSYKLLDFSYPDFDMYVYKFSDGFGGVVLPEDIE